MSRRRIFRLTWQSFNDTSDSTAAAVSCVIHHYAISMSLHVYNSPVSVFWSIKCLHVLSNNCKPPLTIRIKFQSDLANLFWCLFWLGYQSNFCFLSNLLMNRNVAPFLGELPLYSHVAAAIFFLWPRPMPCCLIGCQTLIESADWSNYLAC